MAVSNGVPVLLRTKLYRPPLQEDHVARRHLLRKLDAGLGGKLTLVAAPAGFGKTTLVLSWLAELEAQALAVGDSQWPLHVSWLSVDRHDNDLARFLTYLVAAIAVPSPDACPTFSPVLQTVPLPPADYLVELLVNDLAQLPGRLVIVVDDYQEIRSLAIQQTVEGLLNHLPSNVHLVLISRLDPALPLARLRVQKQVTEIRAAELRFAVAEAGDFFCKALGSELPPDLVQALDERAEGWAAGLRLAALSLQEGADPATFAEAFHGTQRHIMDFLVEQVMASQPPVVVDFLTRTATLEMLCAPLCDAVLEDLSLPPETDARFVTIHADGRLRIDSRAVLEYIERCNLFVVALDGKHHWYRYHHLFREMLVYRLEAQRPSGEIAAGSRRAAVWLARNGSLEAAVRQLLTAGDTAEAADLIETWLPAAMGKAAWQTVQQLLLLLPQDVVLERPVLTLSRAWLMFVMHRFDAIPGLVRHAQALRNQAIATQGKQEPGWIDGWIDGLLSLVDFMDWRFEASLAGSEAALAALPAGQCYARGIVIVYRTLAFYLLGQTDAALATYAQAMVAEQEDAQYRVTLATGFMAEFSADLQALAQVAGSFVSASAEADQIGRLHAWGRLYLGIAAYERNNLAEALEHFTVAFNRRLSTTAVIGVDGICGLALTYQAMGDHESAAAWAATLFSAVSESQNSYYLGLANWFACRLALQRGVAATPPLSYLHVVGAMPAIQMRWSELPDLTYARVLIAQGSKANLVDALALLDGLLERARRHHFTWREVEIQAVRALALQAQGQQEAALDVLADAVRLAQPSGLVRTFVDLGPKLAALLHLLARKGVAADYVGRLLAAFPLSARNAVAVATAEREDEEIIEPLSERELEVLGLLAERLTDKEIAERLRISPLTVRRHSVNLYQKLHVNSRRQAVTRAQSLGLLRVSA